MAEDIDLHNQFLYKLVCSWKEYLQKEVISELNSGYCIYDDKKRALADIFYRIYACLTSISKLNEASDFQSVAILTRTAFELFVDLKLISDKSEIENYRKFTKSERYRSAKQIVDYVTEDPSRASKFPDYDILHDFIKNNTAIPDKKNHWTGISFKDAAKDAQLEFWYFRVYKFLSWQAHGGFAGQQDLDSDSFKRIYGISITYFLDVLSMSAAMLLNLSYG